MDPNWPNYLQQQQQNQQQQQQQNQQLPIISYTAQYQIQNPVSQTNNLLQHHMRTFWEKQRLEIEESNEFKGHSLPLSRIKKIMKSDEQVRMISAEAPVLLSKACDLFIQDLTLRSWISAEECKRRTLQKSDISAAVSATDLFDFLVDIVPREKGTVVSNVPVPFQSPLMVTGTSNEHQLHGQPVDGLPMQLMQDDQVDNTNDGSKLIQGSWSSLARRNGWDPPDL